MRCNQGEDIAIHLQAKYLPTTTPLAEFFIEAVNALSSFTLPITLDIQMTLMATSLGFPLASKSLGGM